MTAHASENSPHDTTNLFAVSDAGKGRIVILKPPVCVDPRDHAAGVQPAITSDAALNLAAWIVAIADPRDTRFSAMVKAIREEW